MIVERINVFGDKEKRLFIFHTEKDMIEVKIDKGEIFTRKTAGVNMAQPVFTEKPQAKPEKKGFFSRIKKPEQELSNDLMRREDEEYFERI